MSFDFDLFVIGAGSGGVSAAKYAAFKYRKKVAICEEREIGGTCVMRGCVPKKLMMYGANFGENIVDAKNYGWSVDNIDFSLKKLLQNTNDEIDRISKKYGSSLNEAGVKIIYGRAILHDKNTVIVGDKKFTAENILIATGAKPVIPNIEGAEYSITSDGLFSLKKLPKKMIIVGGGYIALEFASIFAKLGSEVTQIIRGGRILTGFDNESAILLQEEMQKKGVKFKFDSSVSSIDKNSTVKFTDNSTDQADLVMFAIGRVPNISGIGLEELGVALENGLVVVDKNYKTNIDNIYATGDICNKLQLTPIAIAQSRYCVDNIFGNGGKSPNFDNLPSAVFSLPNLATSGLSEEDAVKLYGDDVGKASIQYRAMKYSMTENQQRDFIKVLYRKSNRKVIGCHIISDYSSEIIQPIAVAINMGASLEDFGNIIPIHPTVTEELIIMLSRI